MVMYFRYVPNQMAPLTIVLSFILAIAANLPRFFELQVTNMLLQCARHIFQTMMEIICFHTLEIILLLLDFDHRFASA